jgi:hypothetical protein
MAIAPVLKTGVRKDLGVRIPHSPPIILHLAADPVAFMPDCRNVHHLSSGKF